MGWLRKLMIPMESGDDPGTYRELERIAGQNMPWWDTRSIPDAFDPEQPQVGFANEHISATDPTWKGPR